MLSVTMGTTSPCPPRPSFLYPIDQVDMALWGHEDIVLFCNNFASLRFLQSPFSREAPFHMPS